jgi:hypothetical protein
LLLLLIPVEAPQATSTAQGHTAMSDPRSSGDSSSRAVHPSP